MLESRTRFSRWGARLSVALAAACVGLAASAQPQQPPASDITLVAETPHASSIDYLAFSPDGRVLVSSGSAIKLWDVATGRLLRTLQGSENTSVVAVMPDGNRIVAAGKGDLLRIWSVHSGVPDAPFAQHPARITAIAVSKSGNTILTGCVDGFARLWDLGSGRLIRDFRGHSDEITAIAFSADGAGFVTASDDKTLRTWKLDASASTAIFRGHKLGVKSVAYAPDGMQIASGSIDGAIMIWDAASGRALKTMVGGTSVVNWLQYAGDGRLLSSDYDHQFKIWDLKASRPSAAVAKFQSGSAVALAPDGASIATDKTRLETTVGPNQRTVLDGVAILDLQSGKTVQTFGRRGQSLNAVVRMKDGTIVVGGSNKVLDVWDPRSGVLTQQLKGHNDTISSLALASGGDVLLSGSHDATVKSWNPVTGALLGTVQTEFWVDGLSAVPGTTDMIASLDADKYRLQSWDIKTRKAVRQFKLPIDAVAMYLAVSPDGRRIATGGGSGELRLWNYASGKLERTIATNGDNAVVAFSPDAALVLSGGWDGLLQLWDANSGRNLRRLRLPDGVRAVGFSGRGDKIIAGGGSTIAVFQTNGSDQPSLLAGHLNDVSGLALSADDSKLFSVSSDGTLRIWNLERGELLLTALERDGEWLAITPEGFFAASENGAKILSIVRDLNVWAIDQFYQALYRPDLVREKLAGDPRGQVRQAAADLDLTKAIASGPAPDVRVTVPGRAIGTVYVDGPSVSVQAGISDRGGGVGRVEWRVNGITLGIDNPGAVAGGQSLQLTRSLALEPGVNSVEVVAYNRANLVASAPASLSLVMQPAAPAPPPKSSAPPSPSAEAPRLFALIAGVNDYADQRIRLSFSVSDAREMARGLGAATSGLYRAVDVKVLTDREVTRDRLDAAFAELAGKLSATDIFVVYFAGHGKTVDGRYYFIPQDFKVDGAFSEVTVNPAVRSKAIAQDQLQRWFATLPARKGIILFDTCESGTLTGDGFETQQLERGAANDRLAQATGRSIITASTSAEQAIEGYRNHGLFTYELLDGLNRADADRNGTIEVSELAAYVYAQVSSLSTKLFNQRQSPQMRVTTDYTFARKIQIFDEEKPVAASKPTHQLAQNAPLQVKPGVGAKVLRSLAAKMPVTVSESANGWSLIAIDGKPLGYVASRDLVPMPQ